MVDGVHAGYHSGQDLRRADVGGGFFAPDVLFAGLQGESVGRIAMYIDADAYQAARHGALERIAAGEESGVRAAITQGHAKTLAAAHDDIRIPLSRRGQNCQGQQIGCHDEGRTLGVDLGNQGSQVFDGSADTRVLGQDGEIVGCGLQQFGQHAHPHFQPQRLGARLEHFDGLRQAVAGHQQYRAFAFDAAVCQGHGFSRSRGLIQHGGVGDGHAGQIAHHSLKIHQRFHASLGNFGLVRGVGGVPGRVFQNVAQDDARRVAAVVALADVAFEYLIFAGQGFELGQRRRLGDCGGDLHGLLAGNGARDDAGDQFGTGGSAHSLEHPLRIGAVDADVALAEFTGVFKFGQTRVCGHRDQALAMRVV